MHWRLGDVPTLAECRRRLVQVYFGQLGKKSLENNLGLSVCFQTRACAALLAHL